MIRRIERLQVAGFRSLSRVQWEPGALNVLIGPNASGKSNLLRVLHMICSAAEGELTRHVQHEGGMGALLWDGAVSRLETTTVVHNEGGLEAYNLCLSQLGNTSGYEIAKESLARQGTKRKPVVTLDRSKSTFLSSGGSVTRVSSEDVEDLETMVSLFRTQSWKSAAIRGLRKYMASWKIYQWLELGPDSRIRQSVVAAVEHHVSADGQNLVEVLHTIYSGNRAFKQSLDDAMKAAFGEEFDELVFPPAADQRIQLRVRWKSLKRAQSAADLSDGTLRFLYLVAILGNPEPAPLIAIDEPDLGLHPSMLPIVAELAAEAARKSQVMLTTHSAAMLDALTGLNPTITVVTSVKGRTQLEVKAGEELAYWLKKYTLGELFRTGELEAMG